jgi:hypothetical protein
MKGTTELVCCILCIRSPCAFCLVRWLVAVLSFAALGVSERTAEAQRTGCAQRA